jgi:hypothetical protein
MVANNIELTKGTGHGHFGAMFDLISPTTMCAAVLFQVFSSLTCPCCVAGGAPAPAAAAADAAPAAGGGAAPAAKKAKEPEPEEDADMGFSLFD